MPSSYEVIPASHSKANKNHPIEKILGELQSGVKTRKQLKEQLSQPEE